MEWITLLFAVILTVLVIFVIGTVFNLDKDGVIWVIVLAFPAVFFLLGITQQINESNKQFNEQLEQDVISLVNETLHTDDATIYKVLNRSDGEYEIIAENKFYKTYLDVETKEIKLLVVGEFIEDGIKNNSQEENPSIGTGGSFK